MVIWLQTRFASAKGEVNRAAVRSIVSQLGKGGDKGKAEGGNGEDKGNDKGRSKHKGNVVFDVKF